MSAARRALAALTLATMLSAPAASESILARSYTSDKLDDFWRATLGSAVPDPAGFAVLAPGPSGAEPVRDAPPDLGVPFFGDVIGETTGVGGTPRHVAFPVIPMAAAEAATMSRRLAWAEIYLSRYRFFETVSTDSAEILKALTARQYAAGLEAYLVTARLYYSAPGLQEKCARLTRLVELAAGPLNGVSEARLPEEWRALLPIQAAAAARLGDEALTELVCAVAPVRGRAEMLKLVETRVRERIVREVRAKVDETLTLLEAAAAEFQAQVNAMDVPIRSAEILELERLFGNAAANLVMVKEDQLKAAATITALQATDLSTLNQPGQVAEFETGQKRMGSLTVLIDEVLGALAALAAIEVDPAAVVELQSCADLAGAYAALDLAQDTGALTRQIDEPYDACIAGARAVVARFQEPSLEKAFMAEFARHVQQISETLLSQVNP